jgi:MFS transporter, DHA1 family, tetracycline resistance protein
MNLFREHRAASVAFILITLFIDSLGFRLVIPILPKLVEQLVGGEISEASFAVGLLTSLYAVMQFFAAPLLGALSDRFGRRPVILLALTSLGVDYVLLSLAPNLWWLVAGGSSPASAVRRLRRRAPTSPMSVPPTSGLPISG